MTKDRRLGRGLAALLGTPLEEDGILEGAAASRSGGSTAVATRPATMPPASGAQHNSALDRNSQSDSHSTSQQTSHSETQSRTSPRSMAEPKSDGTSRPSARETTGDRQLPSAADATGSSVTGSVPLAARPSSRQSASQDGSALNHGDSQGVGSARTAPETKSRRRASDSGDLSTESSHESSSVHTLVLNVSDIDNNPFQPRRRFNESEIASLAESIREHAQLQPILVRIVAGRYQLISGERRLRATIHAGLTTIRAEVREANDRLVAELAIVENLQRKDLDAIEKAMSFRRYIDEHACTQEDLAKRLKIDRSTIANLIRLLELPAELQTWVQNQKITAGHARSLLPLGEEAQQLEFAQQIIDEGWSVRETERRVTAHLVEEDSQAGGGTGRANSRTGPRKRGSPHLASLEQQLRLSLGTKAEIRQQHSGRGKIVINFSNPEEFERLFALVCPQIGKKAA